MRILLDENVPADLARELHGHEVRTVPRMRWSGLADRILLLRASREFEVFVTFDRSIEHQQMLPQSLSLLVLRLPDNKPETVLPIVDQILETLGHIQPGAVVQVPPH